MYSMGVHFQRTKRRRHYSVTSVTVSPLIQLKSEQVVWTTSSPSRVSCDTHVTHYMCHVTLTTDVEVSCYAYEGIDAVKTALRSGLQQSTEEMPLEIRLIAPPQYVITTTTLDRTEGIARVNTAIQVSDGWRGGGCACLLVTECVCVCVCRSSARRLRRKTVNL